ncbi:MAG: bifunctional helix-turn-helix transcriptional regulator/GNAT family N-acetyltransferase [Candidatus Krumholzibacteriia bacterium]
MDLIRDLGELALASRLRRLADTLQADVSSIYRDLGVDFEARWFPVLTVLRPVDSLSVTELAARLGLTHQAVSQTARQMIAGNLLADRSDPADGRRRKLALTRKGRLLCNRLETTWQQIRAANRDLLREADIDLLAGLSRLENALAAESMARRVRRRLALDAVDPVAIVEYRPAYKKHFRRLNEAWLSEHFTIEPDDRRLLDDPNGRIIRRGGAVVFALVDGQVAGTCALICHAPGTWELAKMAVDPAWQRRGLGRRLARSVIARAREAGADRLWLRTSPQLRAAGHLYRSLGFRRTRRHPFPDHGYQRCTHAMVLALDPEQE